MVTIPKRRLTTRVLKISLTVAAITVVFFGLTVFGIEFQSGLRDAQNGLADNLQHLASAFTREVQRRQGRVHLLTENPQAMEAAVQSLKKVKRPEVFFGDGVLFYQILHQSQIHSGGQTGLKMDPIEGGAGRDVLKIVSLPDDAVSAGLWAEDHAMAGGRVFSLRVLWNLMDILPWGDHLNQFGFKGLALTTEAGRVVWMHGDWPEDIQIPDTGVSPREFSWGGKTQIEVAEEMTIFPERLVIRAVVPKSYLYAQAWRMSHRFLLRSAVLLTIGICLLGILAVATRHVMKPLDDITRGVQRVAEGDLETVLETEGEDEIAFLAETLNEMTHRLKVKEQSVQAHIQLLKEKNEELQSLSERLKEADRLKDQFLAVLSHELRTPLTAILGYAELGLEGIYGPLTDKQMETLSYIHSNGNKLLSLMEDLLDIAKIRSGTILVNPERFDPMELLSEIRKFVETSVRQNPDVQFVEDIQPGIPEIYTDRVKLEQILTNLLSNAVKFTERGRVLLSARMRDTDHLEFQVEDTGIGIADQHMPKIFDAFVQLDASIRRRYGGTGLGLTICKGLVERLCGTIKVESELGRGSRFTVVIPVEYQTPAPGAPADVGDAGGARTWGRRADDPDQAQNGQGLLT